MLCRYKYVYISRLLSKQLKPILIFKFLNCTYNIICTLSLLIKLLFVCLCVQLFHEYWSKWKMNNEVSICEKQNVLVQQYPNQNEVAPLKFQNFYKFIYMSLVAINLPQGRHPKKPRIFHDIVQKGGQVAVSKPNFLNIRDCDICIWRVGKRLIYKQKKS